MSSVSSDKTLHIRIPTSTMFVCPPAAPIVLLSEVESWRAEIASKQPCVQSTPKEIGTYGTYVRPSESWCIADVTLRRLLVLRL